MSTALSAASGTPRPRTQTLQRNRNTERSFNNISGSSYRSPTLNEVLGALRKPLPDNNFEINIQFSPFQTLLPICSKTGELREQCHAVVSYEGTLSALLLSSSSSSSFRDLVLVYCISERHPAFSNTVHLQPRNAFLLFTSSWRVVQVRSLRHTWFTHLITLTYVYTHICTFLNVPSETQQSHLPLTVLSWFSSPSGRLAVNCSYSTTVRRQWTHDISVFQNFTWKLETEISSKLRRTSIYSSSSEHEEN